MMKFSDADHLLMSRGRYHYPKKLGRVIGVDMAWELGLLNIEPRLEFSKMHKGYHSKMAKFSVLDDGNYQLFHKYQNLISESFDDLVYLKPKRSKGKIMYVPACIQ